MEYRSGDYFGELALMNNAPRSANIIAKSDCIVVYIDKENFTNLLNTIGEELKTNSKNYKQID